MDKDTWLETKEEVQKSVEAALKTIKAKVKPEDIANSIEVPPSSKMGDLACSIAFPVGKKARKSPREIAEKLLAKIKKPKGVKKVKLSGAYLNFIFDRKDFAKKVITEASKENYGKGDEKKEKVMIEYSQANTHKMFHIGHIRGTSLGESISRILDYDGFDVIRANYQGDVGAHVAKCLWNYTKFHEGEKPKSHKGDWLSKIYAEANKKLEENPDYKEEVSEFQQKLESKEDEELNELWKETRQWSLDEYEDIYEDLGVKFDKYFFESEVEERGKEIVQELRKKKIARKSQGALIVTLKKYGLGDFLLLKSDGTALYSTRDLALAKQKFQEFKIDRSVYVVGSEQRLYFQQLFKTFELMGFRKAKKSHHLAYDLITLKEGKMSSREGTAISYWDLRDKMMQKALEQVMERNPEIDPREQNEMAKQIAIGAMKFSILNVTNTKTIFFDWDKALEFEGETGPYIQYAAVRARRILEKVKKMPELKKVKFDQMESDEEHDLVKEISKLPSCVSEASENYRPYVLAHYTYNLAEKFNSFYNEHRVIEANSKELKEARLALVSATLNTLKICLYLLGIEIPERM